MSFIPEEATAPQDPLSAQARLIHLAYEPAPRLAELDLEIMRIAGLSNAIDYKFIKLLAEFNELVGEDGTGDARGPQGIHCIRRRVR